MSFDPEQITLFAKTDARGQHVPFGIKAKDRTRHVYVIGKTGMGKSTLLENMAVQDIKNGNGLAFIDPHGQTAETLLDYIPEERKNDVLYFAPFDTDNPVSFNVMEDVGPDRRHLVVSGLMSVFKKIWVDAWSARMEYILSNTLLALLEYPDSTLLGVNRMLSDKAYRKKVVENIKDPAVRSFWVDEFANYNERYMQEAGDAIKNKIGQFTANPLIRNIIGQPKSSFDIRKIMDERKIMIMNLSKGLVGEQNANLLGSMLTTRIYLAAMSRADLTQPQMQAAPNFYFYVDEFQSFANATFADILSEARKYKLNLTIAHQYIEQMEEEVRNAVFGNVGTIISFRVGPFDAEILESIFTPKFLAPDIVNLGFAQIYLTLMIDGIGSQPFSATTLPPITLSGSSSKNLIVESSRQQFSKKRDTVEETINEWHETKDAPVQKNNGRGNGKQNDFQKRNNTGSKNDYKKNTTNNYKNDNRNNAGNNNGSSVKNEDFSRNRNTSDDRPGARNKKPNEKSLDDLRSVLKTLSSEETTKKDIPKNNIVKNGEVSAAPQSKVNVKDSSLKDALAAALQGVEQKKQQQQVSPIKNNQRTTAESSNHQHTREAENKRTLSDRKPSQEKNRVQKAPLPIKKTETSVATAQSEPAAVQNSDNPLAPKKLERMMRVTGNDKLPLK